MDETSPGAALAPTGSLRAVINLGNPVLAGGTPDAPSGVTTELARALADDLGVDLRLSTVDGARKAFDALVAGEVDIAFLADEPARAEQVIFTAPYLLIEGVYAVPEGSELAAADEVDRAGVRIAVKEGSAYDLYLTRTLAAAEVVRGADGPQVLADGRADVLAGIRPPVTEYARAHGLRVVEPAFMQIRQAVAGRRGLAPAAAAYLRGFVERAKASGLVADALARAGQVATVAPPAD